MSEVELKIKLDGLPESVVRRLRYHLKDYLTNSGDSDIHPSEPGQRSVKVKVKIKGYIRQKTIRVIKKQKKVIELHEAMAYINSTCEWSQALLALYFPFDERDYGYDRCVSLTVKVIMKPLLMNTNAPAKSYVEIEEDLEWN